VCFFHLLQTKHELYFLFLANFGVGVSSRLRPLALENKVGIPAHWKVSWWHLAEHIVLQDYNCT
jgi:hypothetical protein